MGTNTHSLDLELDSSQSASIADASQTGLDLAGDCTFELWFKPETSDTTLRRLIAKWEDGTDQSYIIDFKSDLVRFVSDGGAGTVVRSWAVTINAGTFYHIAVTFDASEGNAIMYLDTVGQGTDNDANTSIRNSAVDFFLGADTDGSFYDGLLDEVRIWDDIRTSTEIADNWKKDVTGQANLVAYWKLNNGYLDETANDNDLTANNTPTFSTTVPFGDYELEVVNKDYTYFI